MSSAAERLRPCVKDAVVLSAAVDLMGAVGHLMSEATRDITLEHQTKSDLQAEPKPYKGWAKWRSTHSNMFVEGGATRPLLGPTSAPEGLPLSAALRQWGKAPEAELSGEAPGAEMLGEGRHRRGNVRRGEAASAVPVDDPDSVIRKYMAAEGSLARS